VQKEPDRNPRKALGKGLSALLPQRPSQPVSKPEPVPPPSPASSSTTTLPENFEEFQSIPLDQIHPNAEQPRTAFDEQRLEELSQSIRSNGLIQPIAVRRLGEGNYAIIAGERRWRAARLAGLKEIPALVRTVEQDRFLELALIENIQREDLNAIEIASAFQRLVEEHHLSHEQIAERTGKDRSTVTNFLRLLKLPATIQEQLAAGRISMGHARALLNIGDAEIQANLCNAIVSENLSVRETERRVRLLAGPSGSRPSPKSDSPAPSVSESIDPNIRAALDEMSMALGTRVRLVTKNGDSGRIEIEYYSQEDLDRIYSVIVK
jgi:ParB family chromosome partitioning protein